MLRRNTPTTGLRAIAIAGSVLALALTGCTTTINVSNPVDGAASSTQAGEPSGEAGISEANMSDVMFVQMMIPHHEQAVEMSQLAAGAGASPEVQALATRIEQAQGPEIKQMEAMLDRWDVGMMMDHSGHMMSGMLDDDAMEQLRNATGAEFDRLFLESMIEHHEGAIDMAQDPLENGSDPELRQLLDDIVSAQTAEITEMRAMLEQTGS